MVYAVMLAVLILPVLYFKLLHPILVSHFFTKKMVVNSPEMIGYSGNVELLSADGTLIYKGKLDEGRINGKGQLYTYEGALLYEGNFEMEAYSGEGELYYENSDQLCYKGTFLLNQYDGQGYLYGQEGNLIYKGAFKNGLYEGNGTLYFADGQEQYVGMFASGGRRAKERSTMRREILLLRESSRTECRCCRRLSLRMRTGTCSMRGPSTPRASTRETGRSTRTGSRSTTAASSTGNTRETERSTRTGSRSMTAALSPGKRKEPGRSTMQRAARSTRATL